MIGIGANLWSASAPSGGAGGVVTPTFVGYAGNSTGNPVTPPGDPGDLLIGFSPRASATPASLAIDSGWALWGYEAHSVIAMSLAFYFKLATGSLSNDDPIAWQNGGSMRGTWRFKNARPDTLNFSQGGNDTVVAIEPQPTMTSGSLVGVAAVVNSAQTNIANALAGAGTPLANLGFTTRGSRITSLSGWAGDMGPADAFAPANSALDTAGSKIVGAFSIKAAPGGGGDSIAPVLLTLLGAF